MLLKLRVLGAIFKRLADRAGIGQCHRLYKDTARDLRKIELNEDELDWLEMNGISRELPDWRVWQRDNSDPDLLLIQIRHLRSLTTRKMRDELRILHGGRMRRMQDEADAGRIGPILKRVMAKTSNFSMEVLYHPDGNITDPDEVANIVTTFVETWLSSPDEEDGRDADISDFSTKGDRTGWNKLAGDLGIPLEHAEEVLAGMADKPLSSEAKAEAELLNDYIPSLADFNGYIKNLNPKSAGGPSGLTYLIVQQWPDNVRERVYDVLADAWKRRVTIPGWGRRWLQPIPKILDPGLEDLRPLMLVEVTRKIWVGLIMARIADFWSRWGLIDVAQHAYIRGKGTHTAIPQLSNCLEGARDYKTDIYISSWDMKRAFDSLGKKFIIRCLRRLHVPLSLATFMTSLDEEGFVFVKCPKNLKIAEGGLTALDNQGLKFKTRRGTGQGDIPSPLLWVAALDTLLTLLRKHKSEFKTQDLSGQAHPVETIAYADDLLSIESTLEALQKKAHLISAWCILTGIEISSTKLRTFGVHWGVKKKDKPLVVYSKGDREKGWKPKEIPTKGDGSLKHLGLLSDMDATSTTQKRECMEQIKGLGATILASMSRSREKCNALGYCVRTNVGYRAQNSSWSPEDFEDVDKKIPCTGEKSHSQHEQLPVETPHL